jgi:PAS domain S-box-containing protein
MNTATIALNSPVGTASAREERIQQLAEGLAEERGRFAAILDSVPAVVFEYWPPESKNRGYVSRYVETMYGYTPEEWLSTPDFWIRRVHPADRQPVMDDVARAFGGQHHGETRQVRWLRKDGRVIWGETHLRIIRDPDDRTLGIRGFRLDITKQKEAELELEETHRKLVETSRHAGMAEVATGVLHNVGNVLNSVNISATIAADHVRHSSVPHLARVTAILEQNAADIAAYMSTDSIGRKLPAFLGQLAEQLENEQEAILEELEQLGKNVEHIKDIVAVQQNYAKAAGVNQSVGIVELVEDSLRIHAGGLMRHDVQLQREFQARPVLNVDKHKAMQILVNLIHNAKHACDESGRLDKRMTVRIEGDDQAVRVSIIDNGVGIPAENLTRIFSHGFTTRKAGHGFGLHSGALAAKEIGGKLLVHSDGPGRGAAFTLELPLRTVLSL